MYCRYIKYVEVYFRLHLPSCYESTYSEEEEVPKPNLEINSDLHVKCSPIIYRESGVVSAEEARQKRLEALAARGIH